MKRAKGLFLLAVLLSLVSCTKDGNTLYIADICVRPRFRKLGLGKWLIQSLYHVTVQRGLDRLLGGGRMPGYHKGELGKAGHEQQNDERIGQGEKKGGQAVVEISAFRGAALVHVLRGVGEETGKTENQQHKTAHYLKKKLVARIGYQVHHKTHAKTGNQCVEQVARCGANTSHKAVPPAFVQRALHTQYAYRTHRGRCKHTYYDTLEYRIQDIYLKRNWHIDCKVTENRGENKMNSFIFYPEME